MKKNIYIIAIILLFAFVSTIIVADVDYTEYQVKEGETFMEICENLLLDCQTNWKQFLKFNGLSKPTDIVPGMILKVPNSLSKNRYAKVQFIEGTVEVYDEPNDEWIKIRNNHVLVEGNVLKTNEESKCEVKLDDGTLLKLEADTVIGLGELNFEDGGSNTLMDVLQGSVLMKITKLTGTDEFNVETVSAVAGVRGTEFTVTVTGEGEDAVVELKVLEGAVAAKASDNPNDEEELVLAASKGEGDTDAQKIVDEEGGETNIDKEKTIEVPQGYTLQFNWQNDKAIVTQIPEQVQNITITEITDDDEDNEDEDGD
jgi:hypothetical protein